MLSTLRIRDDDVASSRRGSRASDLSSRRGQSDDDASSDIVSESFSKSSGRSRWFYDDDAIPQHAAMFQVGLRWNLAFSWEELLQPFQSESFVEELNLMDAGLIRRAENRIKAKDAEDIEEIELRRHQREGRLAAMTPPGRRPLAEPPVMAWSTIFREDWSEAGLCALLPGDPEKTARAKDLWGELLALEEYRSWTEEEYWHQGFDWGRKNDWRKNDSFQMQFYRELYSEVGNDKMLISKEWEALYQTATKLGQFEQRYLDSDGGTKRIETLLRSGDILFEKEADEIRAKYQHLAPTGYDATPLAMFEYKWCLRDGDTSQLEEALKVFNGQGLYLVFGNTPDEVRDKYGYAVERLLRSEESSPDMKANLRRYLEVCDWKIPSSSNSKTEGTEYSSRKSAEAGLGRD